MFLSLHITGMLQLIYTMLTLHRFGVMNQIQDVHFITLLGIRNFRGPFVLTECMYSDIARPFLMVGHTTFTRFYL